VIAVYVCVDQKTNWRGADAFDRCYDLVGELRVLGIADEDAVRAGEHANPAASAVRMDRIETRRTGKHKKVRCNLVCRDFNLAIVYLLGSGAYAVALLAASRVAEAQAYPTRPITMIVPYRAADAA
jgi:hypothetical protein